MIIVSYDIQTDRNRRRVARILEGTGRRLQKSVFECRCSPGELQKVKQRVQRWIEDGDSVLYLRLCGSCVERVVRVGALPGPEQQVIEL